MQQCSHNDLEFVSAADTRSIRHSKDDGKDMEFDATGWVLVCRNCGALMGGSSPGHHAQAVRAHMKGWNQSDKSKNSGF